MMLLDLIILGIIAGFAIYGFSAGFVHTLSNLVGMVFSIIVAVHTHVTIAFWILPDTLAGLFWIQIVVFMLVLVTVSRLVNILVQVIGKAFDVVSIIPFTKTINRILGVVLGVLEGVIISGAVIFVAMSLPNLPESLQYALNESTVVGFVMFVSWTLNAIFPDASARAIEIFNSRVVN